MRVGKQASNGVRIGREETIRNSPKMVFSSFKEASHGPGRQLLASEGIQLPP